MSHGVSCSQQVRDVNTHYFLFTRQDCIGAVVRVLSETAIAVVCQQVMRTKATLAHELTWAFYRLQRHAVIPQADDFVFLPSHRFNFWRDLRPPFIVTEVYRVIQDQAEATISGDPNDEHPDGVLHDVTYYSAMDYASEHMAGMVSGGGTFDNRVRGVAKVRIPRRFPQVRPVHILSWGRPVLNWTAEDEESDSDDDVAATKNRHEVHKHLKKHTAQDRVLKVTPVKHGLLPNMDAHIKASVKSAAAAGAMFDELSSKRKGAGGNERRPHRVYTASAGFVEYQKR
eukprot:2953458-Amphidinium_carterae.3